MITDKIICGKKYKSDSLAFLTYKNPDGNIGNLKSFTKWIGCQGIQTEIDNTPISGIKIIKTIGGGSRDIRQAYVRIKDPRGFEVEITDENFVNICKKYSVVEGEIIGKYVYGFTNYRIHLVNIEDSSYISEKEYWSTEKTYYNKLQNTEKFSLRDLKIGQTYDLIHCCAKRAIYLGKVKTHTDTYNFNIHESVIKNYNSHVFLLLDAYHYTYSNAFQILTGKQIIGADENTPLVDNSICKEITDELSSFNFENGELYGLMFNKQIFKENSIIKTYLEKHF